MIEALLLRAKHWQVFLLLTGLCVFAGMVGVGVMGANVSSTGRAGTLGLLWGANTALGMLCFAGWFWSMGTFLISIVQPLLRLKTGFFRFSLIYPVLYSFAAGPFFLNPDASMFAVIIPLHFFAVFCMFYSLRFVAKSLVLAETGKPASFYDYAGPFFLIWFFPLGVWFIQPRVNRLYAARRNAEPRLQPTAP